MGAAVLPLKRAVSREVTIPWHAIVVLVVLVILVIPIRR